MRRLGYNKGRQEQSCVYDLLSELDFDVCKRFVYLEWYKFLSKKTYYWKWELAHKGCNQKYINMIQRLD